MYHILQKQLQNIIKAPAKFASQIFPFKAMTCRRYLIFLIQDIKSYGQESVQRHAHAYKEFTKHVSFD